MGQLSDVTRRRIAALLLVAGVLIAVLALTDTGPFDDPPTSEEVVADTVSDLYRAAADGDFETYCSLLTARARELVRINAARLAEEGESLGGCPEILGLAEELFAGGSLRIREVSVSGNRARVEANLRLPDTPGVQPRTVYLERNAAGEWRVYDPG